MKIQSSPAVWRFTPKPDITVQELAEIVRLIIHHTLSGQFVAAIEALPENVKRHFTKE